MGGIARSDLAANEKNEDYAMNLIPSIQGGIGGIGGLEPGKTTSGASESGGSSFARMLDGLQSFEQQGANALTDLTAAREMDLHDVVLAAEMESLAFNLAVEIRNRLVDAYGEISRMQI